MKMVLNKTGKQPTLGTPGAAAYDIYADLGGEDGAIEIHPGKMEMINSGFRMALTPGLVAMLLPRSGLGIKGLVLANGTGVIDPDYREDVMVALKNTSAGTIHRIKHGDRICQMLITVAVQVHIVLADSLEGTERKGGFGSTGLR